MSDGGLGNSAGHLHSETKAAAISWLRNLNPRLHQLPQQAKGLGSSPTGMLWTELCFPHATPLIHRLPLDLGHFWR